MRRKNNTAMLFILRLLLDILEFGFVPAHQRHFWVCVLVRLSEFQQLLINYLPYQKKKKKAQVLVPRMARF